MKHKRDTFSFMRGQVYGRWVNAMGEQLGPTLRFNSLSYGCADILANLVAGNTAYRPVKMGFIYGDRAVPGLLPVTREQSWATLQSDVSAIVSANMQISPFSLPPAVSIDDLPSPAGYAGNSVTFSGITRSGSYADHGFPYEAPFAGVLADGHYLYQAVLLAEAVTGVYIPMARVSLDESTVYAVKPAGYELALFWQVSFF